jgi:NADP-dependent alcohol dehydrogenase
LPENQTANGIGDAFAHVIEQYITYPVDSPLQDRFAESLLLTFMESAPKVFSNPNDYNARANIMWCATMALNNILSCGVPEDWASHLIGHVLTAKYGLDHAKTLSVVLPNLLRVRKAQKKVKLLQYAQRVWGITDGDDDERIEKAIIKTEEFFHSINLKTKLSDYGIGEEVIPFALAKYKDYGMTAIGEDGGVTLAVTHEVLQRSL